MITGLLISVTLTMSLQNCFRKNYQRNPSPNKIGSYGYNLITVVTAWLFFWLMPKTGAPLPGSIFLYAAAFAIAFFCAMFFMLRAIEEGPLSLSALINSYSLIIPTFFGVFFLRESFGSFKLMGIALLMVSLYLVGSSKNTDPLSGRWMLFITLSFLGNGLCSTVQKVYQVHSGGQFKAEFMLIALTVTSVAALAAALIRERRLPLFTGGKGGLSAVGCGACIAATNMIVMMLAKYPSALVYPTISGGSVILTFLISNFLYREQLTSRKNAGFLIGVLAVIFLNL